MKTMSLCDELVSDTVTKRSKLGHRVIFRVVAGTQQEEILGRGTDRQSYELTIDIIFIYLRDSNRLCRG